jgi:pyrroline-5-carboxylate reductase
METKSLGFIGGGRITRIILQAFHNKEVSLTKVVVYDTNPEVLSALKKQFPGIEIADTAGTAAKQEIVFIALHPPVIMETLDKIQSEIAETSVVISLAPKISLEKIGSVLKTGNIARMIPNATSFINEGYNPITFSSGFDSDKKQMVLEMIVELGYFFETEEAKLESYAIISAMLPTYFWFQWEECCKIGMQTGLTETESREAVFETLYAAMNLMFNSGLTFNQVDDLIPVKPIGGNEEEIKTILNYKLLGLFEKIKP